MGEDTEFDKELQGALVLHLNGLQILRLYVMGVCKVRLRLQALLQGTVWLCLTHETSRLCIVFVFFVR